MIGLIRMGSLCIKDILRGILRCESYKAINNHLNSRKRSSNSFFEVVNRIMFMFTMMALKFLWVFGKKIDENYCHTYDQSPNLAVSLKWQI